MNLTDSLTVSIGLAGSSPLKSGPNFVSTGVNCFDRSPHFGQKSVGQPAGESRLRGEVRFHRLIGVFLASGKISRTEALQLLQENHVTREDLHKFRKQTDSK